MGLLDDATEYGRRSVRNLSGLLDYFGDSAQRGVADYADAVEGRRLDGSEVSGTERALTLFGNVLPGTGASALAPVRGAVLGAQPQRLAQGLNLSEDARAARAARQGYQPETLYHGTPGRLEGDGIRAFDMTRNNPRNLYGPGVYMTDNPKVASGYAQDDLRMRDTPSEAPTVYPLRHRVTNPLDLDAPLSESFLKASDRHFQHLGGLGDWTQDQLVHRFSKLPAEDQQALFDRFPVVIPEGLSRGERRSYELTAKDKGHLAEDSDIAAFMRDRGEVVTNRDFYDWAGDMFHDYKDRIVPDLKALGHDGIVHEGGHVTGGEKHKVVIAFDPSQVRSPTAAFDGRRKNSPDLLAGHANPAAGAGLLSDDPRVQEWLNRGGI